MRTLSSFKDIHKGETIIVCGCGESLNDFEHPEQFITIGVNDVSRRFHPDYLVVLNPRNQFAGDRFSYIENSRAKYLFTQLDLGHVQSEVVRFRLGKKSGTDFSDPNVLHYTQNSPYVAICLAVHMGASRIGIIGVDFTDNHFFKKTGRHVLSNRLTRMDAEYKNLEAALSKQGVAVINLSSQSRLTAFKKGNIGSLKKMDNSMKNEREKRIFFVNYKFLSCGDVFRHGLSHAAEDLGIEFSDAYWDDNSLPGKIAQFNPDLVFVVHGRKFANRWKDTFRKYNTAVWLLDEPYEVDDTAKFSGCFDTVFINDPGTRERHKNAHYLPVCYDPRLYCESNGAKKHDVGFIGGSNPVRRGMLEALADEGLLSYVVGGPWNCNKLDRLCLSANISHEETANLYKQTKIVVNIFRSLHHFNKQKIPAVSLNPRIYEALACGALVVTQKRPEVEELFPALPVFETKEQLVSLIRELSRDEDGWARIREACKARLVAHTYSQRLKTILDIAVKRQTLFNDTVVKKIQEEEVDGEPVPHQPLVDSVDWLAYGKTIQAGDNGTIVLYKGHDQRPGSEEGLVSREAFESTDLSFDVNIQLGAVFIAKIQQVEKFNQLANSYHLFCNQGDYFARHNHIFRYVSLERDCWQNIRILFTQGLISLYKNNRLLFHLQDTLLKKGYAFVGIKGGRIQLRNIKIAEIARDQYPLLPLRQSENEEYDILMDNSLHLRELPPTVSIVTTVFDRVDCLRNCIKSVKQLQFQDYQHIIVADCPPPDVLNRLEELVHRERDPRMSFINLKKRYNNWGIKPASIGIRLSLGKYICFLSDDNGYTPDHMGMLVSALEQNPDLGFVYSSCRYAGRSILKHSVPQPGRIDLGQPMFRRELFGKCLGDDLPFDMMAWDWHMIEAFMKHGVNWKHLNRPTFLFRLHKYPSYIAR